MLMRSMCLLIRQDESSMEQSRPEITMIIIYYHLLVLILKLESIYKGLKMETAIQIIPELKIIHHIKETSRFQELGHLSY